MIALAGQRVLVLYNAPPPDAGASVAGVLEQVNAVSAALDLLGMTHRVAGVRDLEEAARILGEAAESVVFNLVEGFEANPMSAFYIPALAEAFGRAVTGSATPCLTLTLDKTKTRGVLREHGIPVPEGTAIAPGEPIRWKNLPADGPYIVKPAALDASEGIDGARSVLSTTGSAMRELIQDLQRRYRQTVLVERFVGTRELNVSIIENRRRIQVLPVAEIDFSRFPPERPRIVDYAAKWETRSFAYRHTPRIIPADLPRRLSRRAEELAVAAWKAMGCQDYARVDMRIDDEGRVYVLEVNANPDLSPDAGFQAALRAGAVAFQHFVRAGIENALGRYRAQASPRRSGPDHRTEAPAPAPLLRGLRRTDREPILDLLVRTAVFRNDELDVAREVLDAELASGRKSGYQSVVAEVRGEPAGWISFGPVACAIGTWDVYWIAVDPKQQHRGIGSVLLRRAEELIAAREGRLIVIETSDRTIYDPSRRFYVSAGYEPMARLPDFFTPGDGKVFFVKAVAGDRSGRPEAAAGAA